MADVNEYKIYKQGQEIKRIESRRHEYRFLVVSGLQNDRNNDLIIKTTPFNSPFEIYSWRIKKDMRDYVAVTANNVFNVGDDITLINGPSNLTQINRLGAFLNKIYSASEDMYKKITKVIKRDGMIFYNTKEDGNNELLDLSLFYRKVNDSDKADSKYIKDIILKDIKKKSELGKINLINDSMSSNSLIKLKEEERKQILYTKNKYKESKLNLRNYIKGLKQSLQKLNESKDVMNVIFDKETNELNIYTPFILSEFERGKVYPMGHYKFSVKPNISTDILSFDLRGIRLEGKSSYEGAMHHCIQPNGKICFGEYIISSLVKEGKVFEIYLLFLSVLRNFPITPDYNPKEFYEGLSSEFRIRTNHLIESVSSKKSNKIYQRRYQ